MTLAAQYGASDFRLKRNLIVLATVVAHDLEASRRVVALACLFRTALGAPLRRHHIALVEDLLFFFSEEKSLPTLNARSFDVRHIFASFSAKQYG